MAKRKNPYEFRVQKLHPHKTDVRPTWLVNWYDRNDERKCASLGTTDEGQARRICIDLETICNDPSLWDQEPKSKALSHLNGKARQIFFGLAEEPKVSFRGMIDLRTIDSRHSFGGNAKTGKMEVVNVELPQTMLTERIEKDREIDSLKKKVQEREKVIEELRERLNLHCDELLGPAAEKYIAHYSVGHDSHTVKQVKRAVNALVATIGKEFRLGDVTGAMISDHVASLKRRDGGEMTSITRRKNQAYISTFCGWATKQYVLSMNPMMHVHAVAGANKPTVPVAITKYADLTALLDALKPHPYWRAWVAFAVLAGPRWSEQAVIKVSEFSEAFTEVTIHGNKTKRIRKTPIEGKVLRPILREYLEKHRDGKDTDLLFPSPVEGHGSKPDRVWRSSTWHKHWWGGWDPKSGNNGKIIKKGKWREGVHEQIAKDKTEEFWGYGPAEWRHTAATAMGHADVGALRISQWIGNSEGICRKFYVSAIGSEIWPLEYVMKQH